MAETKYFWDYISAAGTYAPPAFNKSAANLGHDYSALLNVLKSKYSIDQIDLNAALSPSPIGGVYGISRIAAMNKATAIHNVVKKSNLYYYLAPYFAEKKLASEVKKIIRYRNSAGAETMLTRLNRLGYIELDQQYPYVLAGYGLHTLLSTNIGDSDLLGTLLDSFDAKYMLTTDTVAQTLDINPDNIITLYEKHSVATIKVTDDASPVYHAALKVLGLDNVDNPPQKIANDSILQQKLYVLFVLISYINSQIRIYADSDTVLELVINRDGNTNAILVGQKQWQALSKYSNLLSVSSIDDLTNKVTQHIITGVASASTATQAVSLAVRDEIRKNAAEFIDTLLTDSIIGTAHDADQFAQYFTKDYVVESADLIYKAAYISIIYNILVNSQLTLGTSVIKSIEPEVTSLTVPVLIKIGTGAYVPAVKTVDVITSISATISVPKMFIMRTQNLTVDLVHALRNSDTIFATYYNTYIVQFEKLQVRLVSNGILDKAMVDIKSLISLIKQKVTQDTSSAAAIISSFDKLYNAALQELNSQIRAGETIKLYTDMLQQTGTSPDVTKKLSKEIITAIKQIYALMASLAITMGALAETKTVPTEAAIIFLLNSADIIYEPVAATLHNIDTTLSTARQIVRDVTQVNANTMPATADALSIIKQAFSIMIHELRAITAKQQAAITARQQSTKGSRVATGSGIGYLGYALVSTAGQTAHNAINAAIYDIYSNEKPLRNIPDEVVQAIKHTIITFESRTPTYTLLTSAADASFTAWYRATVLSNYTQLDLLALYHPVISIGLYRDIAIRSDIEDLLNTLYELLDVIHQAPVEKIRPVKKTTVRKNATLDDVDLDTDEGA